MHNDNVYKTIYSPSPSNFHEPQAASFTGFSRNGFTSNYADFNVSGSWNNGWDFYRLHFKTGATFHFYALNLRVLSYTWGDINKKAITVPTFILIWTAFPASSISAWALGSSVGDVRNSNSTDIDVTSSGYIVLPVHE